jgi:hypothetical protein
MQQVSDCDILLAHDNDLATIDGIGHDTVSGLLNSSCDIALLMLAVTGNPRTRGDDGSSPEVQHRDT